MNVTQNPREELAELIVANGTDRDAADRLVGNLDTDEKVAEATEIFRGMAAEREAFRARLVANPVLMKAVCPGPDWKTPADRYDVARRAVTIMEAYATKHGVTVDEIAETLVAQHGTIADAIAMWSDREGGYDPRSDGWEPVRSFYAFRFRLNEAIETLKADEIRAERLRKIAAQDAAWARQGLVRCDHCGGVGGASHWPGYTCYDCGGVGAVPAKH